MKNHPILHLDEVRLSDAARAGRKAATLGDLREAGFPVLPGLIVPVEAFHRALGSRLGEIEAALDGYDLGQPVQAQEAARRTGPWLEDLAVPELLRVALGDALAYLPWNGRPVGREAQPLAVRSSATAEDGDGASFAGQYASRIGVLAGEGLAGAILDVWRSFFSPHALAARHAHGALAPKDGMAVLIQPALDPECAGVLYTVDPTASGSGHMLISACWGQGAGVAEGSVAADTYRVRRSDLQPGERRVVEKPEYLRLAPAGGLQRLPVPADRTRAACLPEGWLRRLAELGWAIELLFGCPQDVEWAISANQIWVLQSRPVAALPAGSASPIFPLAWETPADRRRLWRLVPFASSGPLLPAVWDYTNAGAAAKQDAALYSGLDNTLEVKFFNGRPYFSLLSSPLSPGDRRIRREAQEDLIRRLFEEGRNGWDYWGPEVVTAARRLGAFDLDGALGVALADHLEDVLGAQRRHWTAHANIWEPAWEPLSKAYAALTGLSGEAMWEAVTMLLQGEENALGRLIDGLYALAGAARGSVELVNLLLTPPPNPLERLAALAADRPEPERSILSTFQDQFTAFLAEYGDRSGQGFGSESTFLTLTWREEPSVPLLLVAAYLDPASEAPAEARRRARQACDARIEAVLRSCPDPAQVEEFRRLLAQARRDATALEDHNHYIDQATSALERAAFLAAGRRLVEKGDLGTVDDVFWLQAAEICSLLRGEDLLGKMPSCPTSNTEEHTLASIIASRKARHEQWAAMETPPILGLPDAVLGERPPLEPELSPEAGQEGDSKTGSVSLRLTGQAAGPGRSQGRARVVTNGAVLPDLSPGDILVAPNAGPLWTPFFPILGGLVLDGGVLGQHAASTAREYGIPAVIGARAATERIRDGDWILVDGTQGIVELAPSRL